MESGQQGAGGLALAVHPDPSLSPPTISNSPPGTPVQTGSSRFGTCGREVLVGSPSLRLPRASHQKPSSVLDVPPMHLSRGFYHSLGVYPWVSHFSLSFCFFTSATYLSSTSYMSD